MAQIAEAPQPPSAVRKRLTILLAIVLIAAVVTLLAVAGAFTSGVGIEEPKLGFGGGGVIHDEPGNVHFHPSG